MKKLICAVALMGAGQAGAQAVSVSSCAFVHSDIMGAGVMVECAARNLSQTPVAALRYSIKFSEPGRTVPWFEESGKLTSISGGIEPGESVATVFRGSPLSSRADPDRIEIHIGILEALDVNGEAINAPD